MGNTGIVDPAKNVCLVNISNSDALRKQLKNVTPKFSGMVRSMGGARIALVLDTATKKTGSNATQTGTNQYADHYNNCLQQNRQHDVFS